MHLTTKQLLNMTKVRAFGAISADAPMRPLEIERRILRPTDVELEILYCGICHSDLHSVRNDWGNAVYPQVPGHEIVGRITAVGADVKTFTVGDLGAIGCIIGTCGTCDPCHEGEEQYCEHGVTFSFNSPDPTSGGMTYGGFSERYVCDEQYVLHMPPFDQLGAAAPLLCAGITVYSPMKHWGIGEGKRIGIIGIGGLGHMAIKIARALGAEVTVFTTSESKVQDALRLGAHHAILSTDRAQMKASPRMDMILDTVSGDHDVNPYLSLLRTDGTLVIVGLPTEPLAVRAYNLVHGRRSFAGSNIGSIAETQEMLDFCYQHGITAECEMIRVEEINQAMGRLERGDVRYRFVIDMQTL